MQNNYPLRSQVPGIPDRPAMTGMQPRSPMPYIQGQGSNMVAQSFGLKGNYVAPEALPSVTLADVQNQSVADAGGGGGGDPFGSGSGKMSTSGKIAKLAMFPINNDMRLARSATRKIKKLF